MALNTASLIKMLRYGVVCVVTSFKARAPRPRAMLPIIGVLVIVIDELVS